jgi:serine/threonine protein kinase
MSAMLRDDAELDREYLAAGCPKDIAGFLEGKELAPSLRASAPAFLLQIYCDHTYGDILTTSDAPRFNFIQRISETQYHSVYKVQDNETECLYVLKIANPKHREEARRLLDNERAKYEAVTSPHVVKCHSFNYTRKDGRDFLLYLVLTLVEGTDLSQNLKQQAGRRQDYQRVAALARDIASGLADLHSRGIVHRDIKPANIIVSSDGKATLIDLGIAADVTDAPDRAGTEGYVSPERALGNNALLPSDVFSFGLVLWELLVGTPYFSTSGPAYWKEIALHHEPQSLHNYRADAPDALHTLVATCLQRLPEARPKAREIVELLNDYLASYGPVLDGLCTYTDRSTYIAAQCAEVFDELASVVDDWFCSPQPSNRVLAITGNPGDGKTYFVSWWTRRHVPEAAVLVWLCNDGRFDNNRDSTCDPTRFVAQLIRQLSHRVPGYPGSVTFDRHALEQTPLDALARYVIAPLKRLRPSLSQPTVVIAIDGIEMAAHRSFAHGVSMADVVRLLAEQLPGYFRLIITSRPGDGGLQSLAEYPVTIALNREHRSLVTHASIALCNHYLETNRRFADRVAEYARRHSIGAPLEGEALESVMRSHLAFGVQIRDQNLQSTKDWCEGVAAGRVGELLTADYTSDTEARAFRSFLEGPAKNEPEAYGLLLSVMCAAPVPIPEELLELAVPDWPNKYRDASRLITKTPQADVSWQHPSYPKLAVACQSRIRIYLPAGHEVLAKACRHVLSNTLGFPLDCHAYAREHYGYHLLGSRDLQAYRHWLLGEERSKAMVGYDAVADTAVSKDYALLKDTKRCHFILSDDEVHKTFIRSGIRSLARVFAATTCCTIRHDLTPDFVQAITDVVEAISDPHKKLLVFGPETECVAGVSPWEQTDYNSLIMDPLWSHPVHIKLQQAIRRQARNVLRLYADVYLRLTGLHSPAAITDDTREVIRRNGYGAMFIAWVTPELQQQRHEQAPSLAWVNIHYGLMVREFCCATMEEWQGASAESQAKCVEWSEDPNVSTLLHMLFAMGMGWTPGSDLKSQWATCPWTEVAATPGSESKVLSSVLGASGGLDAVDAFIREFRCRRRPN